tara:strand:- start:679 stop:855 length:177 start_codon:yes stop_codon:yes gene_type:complete
VTNEIRIVFFEADKLYLSSKKPIINILNEPIKVKLYKLSKILKKMLSIKIVKNTSARE